MSSSSSSSVQETMHSICHLALNQLPSQSSGSSKENLVRKLSSFLLLSISNDRFPMKSTEQKQKHQEEKVLLQNSQHDQYCPAFQPCIPAAACQSSHCSRLTISVLSKPWACPVLRNSNETSNVIPAELLKKPSKTHFPKPYKA